MKMPYEIAIALLNDGEKQTIMIDGKPTLVVTASGVKKLAMLSGHPDAERIYESLMKQVEAMLKAPSRSPRK